jgi:hypothetical protein
MANRKQRRRREKGKRHEYEVVYLDDEGNEVDYEPDESEPRRERAAGRERAEPSGRGAIQPPSWSRTAKRGLIFAPIMFATVLLISPDDATIGGQVVQALLLLALFLPFSYFLDSVLWRSHRRRLAKPTGTRATGKH